jgi:hypothetical protein
MVVTPLRFMVRDRLAASLSRGDAREFDAVQVQGRREEADRIREAGRG